MKLKNIFDAKNMAINKLLGDEFYVHEVVFIDNKPVSLCYFYKSGSIVEKFADHIDSQDENTYVIFHKLMQTPNHNEDSFCINIDKDKKAVVRFSIKENIDNNTNMETVYEYSIPNNNYTYMICIEPGRNTNHYVFLFDSTDDFDYYNPINVLLDSKKNCLYDSREHCITIHKHTYNIQEIKGVDDYVNRYIGNLTKAEKDLNNIIINENGEVDSYKSDSGICFERIINKDSEYPIDYTNLTYFLEKRNVIKKEHIFGSINDIVIDTNEEKDHYISENNINEDDSVTLYIDIIGTRYKSVYKKGIPGPSIKIDGESEKISPEVSTNDNGSTKINNPDGTYSIINVSNKPGVYDIETCNNDGIKFMHNRFDTESKVSVVFIDKNSSVSSDNNINANLSNGINVSYNIDENGKVKQYKDTFQEITFDNEGNIFFYDSDVFEDTGTYYIRDQFGVPHKYSPTLLGFDL